MNCPHCGHYVRCPSCEGYICPRCKRDMNETGESDDDGQREKDFSEAEGGWVHVFKAGEYPQGTFTEDDLQEVVDTYDPALLEAPAVLGHPKLDDPAYGWVQAIRREGEDLYVRFKQLVPEFAEAVRKGLWKKVSVRLSEKVIPGKWYLKHVGFLGAQVPQIKGLAPVEFKENPEDVDVDFEESQPKEGLMTPEEIQALLLELQKQLEESKSKIAELEQALAQVTSAGKVMLEESKAKIAELEAKAAASPAPEKNDEGKEEDPQFAEMQRKNSALERKVRRMELERKVAELKDFPPSLTDGLVDFMGLQDEGREVEFSEGTGKVKKSPVKWFEGFLDRIGKVVDFSDLSRETTTRDQASKRKTEEDEDVKRGKRIAGIKE